MSSKTGCTTCENKDTRGVFKCEGCLETFCLKHANEHRLNLDFQLDEVLLEHENLFYTLKNNRQQSSVLFDQINQWEIDAIGKIQKTAEEARLDVQRLAEEEKKHSQEKFDEITRQLANAREHQEYLEKDLSRWKMLLEQFKYDLTVLSPSITLQQDLNDGLIPKLVIAKVNQQSILNESLTSDSDQIQFDDYHHMAMHCGPSRAPAYVSGTQEYASGQHQIRLFISKRTNKFILAFNIMSKSMELSSTSDDLPYLTYGWQSDDCINPSQYCSLNEKSSPDLRGKTKFHLRLFIDCDRRMISYFNEKTKRKREINVDITKCPLPWRLSFYLYDIGDTVRLLSSSRIS